MRLCAEKSLTTGAITGYIYDAEGNRVAKGTLTSFSCDLTQNGFTTTTQYIVGQSGEQVTAVDGSGNWKRSNVYAAGAPLATYDAAGLHFNLSDALGTKRVQVNATGVVEQTCQSLPFGDALSCTGAGADDNKLHFTAKERDTESGNDYFGARYLSSNVGRFLSPDPSDGPDPVPFGDLGDPQSLNLYAYVGNNPLTIVDDDGHDGAVPAGKCGFLCWFARMFSGGGNSGGSPPPPPPPPAPPVPPGGPGSQTGALISAQDAARANPAFQINTQGTTFCNVACRNIARAVGGTDMGPLRGTANDISSQLAHSGNYHRVGRAEAQRLANTGKTVLGVWKNPSGHGHIITVRPDEGPFVGSSFASSGPNDPIINDIGSQDHVVPLSQQGFPPFVKGVIFYAPN